MDTDLQKARSLLQESGFTSVLCKDAQVYTSTLRGVAPLLELLNSQTDVRGFCAADKVVGSAAAHLFCLLGVRCVYASVVSTGALQILRGRNIPVFYDTETAGILNRRKTGPCPMESATRNIQTPEQALAAIRLTLQTLQTQK